MTTTICPGPTSTDLERLDKEIESHPIWTELRGPVNTYLNKPLNTFTNSTSTQPLTQLGQRQYAPALGRFITIDPLLETADPQALNGYSYSDNNPINKSDPTGLCPKDVCGSNINEPTPAQVGGTSNYCDTNDCYQGGDGPPAAGGTTRITSNVSIANGTPHASALQKAFDRYASSVGYLDGYGTPFMQASQQLSTWAGFCDTTGSKLCGRNLTMAILALYWVYARGSSGAGLGQLVIGEDPNPVASGGLGLARDLSDVPVVEPSTGEVSGPPDVLNHYTIYDTVEKVSNGGNRLLPLSGKIWLTPDQYTSGTEARANLALDKTPDGYYPIPVERITNLSGPARVQPDNGELGGGTEYTTTDPISVEGIDFIPFSPSGE